MEHPVGLAANGALQPTAFAVQPWREFADHAGWAALAEHAVEPNPFAESWCLAAGLEALDREGAVNLASLAVGDRLVGLLPVVRSLGYERYPLPNIRNWQHANAFCGAPLVAKGYEHAFWHGLLHWADRNARSALFLHLGSLPADGALFAALREVCSLERRSAAIVHSHARAMLRSRLSPDAYFDESLSAKKRKELRRQFNRLSETGNVSFDRRDDAADLESWIEGFLSLEAAGWKGSEGSALGCDPATAAFFRSALSGAAAAGKLERLTIALDGRPVAMLANFIARPGAFSFKTTYDEALARYSPGVLLQRENLALLARDDVEWADSCADPDHPMIDRIWREKRRIVRVSIAIGGPVRRRAAALLFRAETGAKPEGL
jgi:CelD/BcsL family acetyltransferase involved in cellulose biosynthesis